MTFLVRFWPHLLIAGAVIVAGVWINRLGYESGHAASEAYWRPAFDRAREELAAANELTRQRDIASKALTQKAEVEHVAQMALRDSRIAAADVRVRQLMRDNAKRADCRQLPETSGPAPNPDAAGTFVERSERAGADLIQLARRCEEDAASLTTLQKWLREQRLIDPQR